MSLFLFSNSKKTFPSALKYLLICLVWNSHYGLAFNLSIRSEAARLTIHTFQLTSFWTTSTSIMMWDHELDEWIYVEGVDLFLFALSILWITFCSKLTDAFSRLGRDMHLVAIWLTFWKLQTAFSVFIVSICLHKSFLRFITQQVAYFVIVDFQFRIYIYIYTFALLRLLIKRLERCWSRKGFGQSLLQGYWYWLYQCTPISSVMEKYSKN